MYRLPPAALAGIFTVGVWPKLPVAVTDPFGLDGLGAGDEPQPARAAVAMSGTKSAPAMRRMGFLMVGMKSAASLPAADCRAADVVPDLHRITPPPPAPDRAAPARHRGPRRAAGDGQAGTPRPRTL